MGINENSERRGINPRALINVFNLKERKLPMNIAIVYILISVLGGAIGQVLLKRGMSGIGPLTLSASGLPGILLGMATNPFVVIGLTVYLGSTVFWLTALSRVDLSYAYPFASLSYVAMLLASWQIFHEDISVLRLVGSCVILTGVILISRS
jgi:drug/metabolite transporter (DMT)-like permease